MQTVARQTKTPPPPPPPRLSIGPADAGLRLTWNDFAKADWQEGFRYELIDGRLMVSPTPEVDHDDVDDWVLQLLSAYSHRRPNMVNRISNNARIFIPKRPDVTVPQPDLAVYRDFPLRRDRPKGFSWKHIYPIIVIEILSPGNHDKDVVRNVILYELAVEIREYWIFDGLEGNDQLTMTVYRRRGEKWQKPIVLNMGDVYTTKLLPGFRLRLDPIP